MYIFEINVMNEFRIIDKWFRTIYKYKPYTSYIIKTRNNFIWNIVNRNRLYMKKFSLLEKTEINS